MRLERTGLRVEFAWHGDDLTMHPSRKICRCKLGRLAEGLRDTAVVLARNFRIEIRVAETGEEKLVERGRAESLGREQVAVEEPRLLLEVTGILLAARVEHG